MTAADELRSMTGILTPARLTEIVDIGAYPTETPVYMPLVEAEAARITGFEPQPSAFAALAERNTDFERYLPYAVGDGTTRTLNVCRSSGFTSLYTPDPQASRYLNKPRWPRLTEVVERIEIDTKRLDDMDEIVTVDLLKIDIQGGEVSVFENARDRLSKALAVITEVGFLPIYEDQPLLDDQMRELRAQGFLLHSFQSMVGASLAEARDIPVQPRHLTAQLIDGDAVFLRDPRRMEAFSDEQLKHYALIAHGALRLPDLVARCLGELIRRNVLGPDAIIAYCDMLGGKGAR